jgi:hypothetical protein
MRINKRKNISYYIVSDGVCRGGVKSFSAKKNFPLSFEKTERKLVS